MNRTLSAIAIMATLASPVYAGNVDTFHGSTGVAENNKPMGGSNAAWIIPLVAIIAIAAANKGGKDAEPEAPEPAKKVIDPCACVDGADLGTGGKG